VSRRLGLNADNFSLHFSTLRLFRFDDKRGNQVPGSEPIPIAHRRFTRIESAALLHTVPDAHAWDLGSDDAKVAAGRGVQPGGFPFGLLLIPERADLNRQIAASARKFWAARGRGLRNGRRFLRFDNAFLRWRQDHLLGSLRSRFLRGRLITRRGLVL